MDVAIPFAEDTVHCTYEPAQASAFWRQLVQAQRVLQQSGAAELGSWPI